MTDLELARKVLKTEAAAILALVDRVDERFAGAVALLCECRGRVIVTGMGKSGIIARKIAATFSSTGTPAFFLHPAEAVHGDLGAVQGDDIVIALSHTGETGELLRLLEMIRRIGAKLVAMTGFPASTLGRAADVVLDCGVDEEACPMNLAPTASTTAALAMGDALAMTLLVEKGFRPEDFASLHPGGSIGKRLMRVEALMHTGAQVPSVLTTTPLRAVVAEISAKGLGMACVVDDGGCLAGIITDGDLRRHMDVPDLLDQEALAVMTASPRTVDRALLAVQALAMMEQRKITSLVVVDADTRVEGVLHLHDLWRTQMF
jgi:arabinose-5-phosphate isomerase